MKVGVYMEYKFSEVVDLNELGNLMENFYDITGIRCSIKDHGDTSNLIHHKDICEKFHRLNPLTKLRCCEHEKNILNQMKRGKKFVIYKCENGLMYIGTPIIINKVHSATIFTSPIFFEEPDIQYFKSQAKEFQFDVDEYIKSIKDIPVIPREKIKLIIKFICDGARMLGEIGYKHFKNLDINRKLNQSYIELSGVYQQLSVAEQQLRLHYDEMERVAYYDQLTSLPNWNFFRKELDRRIKENRKEEFAVLHVDLDNFKNVNDIFGYEYGDKLLKKIGDTLVKLDEDNIVARAGGNEFLVLLPKKHDEGRVADTAQYILDTLSGLWILDGKESIISVSIGITVYPDDGDEVTTILRNADIAVNKTKDSGKNSYKLFEKSMYDEILRKTEMEKELRKAIKNNEFILYYQPQVDIKTRKIVSFEALIRWNSSKFGWVMPMEFISLAEETGLIVPIGEWVLKTACLQNKEWKSKGYSYDFISINVSPIQLQKNGFLDMVNRVLRDTAIEPKFLEIEITETVMMESLEWNLTIINELKNMGIRVALDDFGRGYSSLNYLKSLPINTLKIDKTFIDGLCNNSYEDIITEEIIKLAHRMKLEVVAEGVEVEEQLISLQGKNCNKIQGYYFGKPMPAEKIADFFES